MPDVAPLRGEPAAASCPVCQQGFSPGSNQRYCSQTCRDAAWRRRHQQAHAAVAVPPARPRGALTVSECAECGTRSLGAQRCEDCGSFMRRVGIGGRCTSCDEVLTIDELVGEEATVRTNNR